MTELQPSKYQNLWWNCDLVLWRLVCWDRFLIYISYKSNYDISLTSQDTGLENCSLSNRLLNIDTQGNDQGLTVTSSPYGTKEAKHLCHKSLRQSWTCHLFIKICAPRAPSEYQEDLFTSIMCDIITYPCNTCVQHAKAISSPQYFWNVITYNIYACRWKYTNSSMSFWPSDYRLLMEIFLWDPVFFERGTLKHWNIQSEVEMPTPHSITTGFCGMWLIIHVHPYSPFCRHDPHMKRTHCNIGSNTGVSESTWMSNYTSAVPQEHPVRRSNFISQYFVRRDYLSMQRHLHNSVRDPIY